jgi:hypothetical protein
LSWRIELEKEGNIFLSLLYLLAPGASIFRRIIHYQDIERAKVWLKGCDTL